MAYKSDLCALNANVQEMMPWDESNHIQGLRMPTLDKGRVPYASVLIPLVSNL